MPCGGGGIGGGGALIMSTSMAAIEPNQTASATREREPPPAPLENGVPAAGERREREVVEQTEKKNEGRPASRDQVLNDSLCVFAAAASWDGAGLVLVALPAISASQRSVSIGERRLS